MTRQLAASVDFAAAAVRDFIQEVERAREIERRLRFDMVPVPRSQLAANPSDQPLH